MRLAHAVPAASLAVVLSGCAGAHGGAAQAPPPAANPAASTTATVTPSPVSTAPAPGVRISTDPAKLAASLKATSTALMKAIDAWTTGRPPADLVLYALHQQRVYRAMARDNALAKATIRLLPKKLAAEARDNVTAIGKLLAMAHPITAAQRRKMRLAEAPPARQLRGHMVRAEKRFGVEWEVLAAIMLVETKFGRVRSSSSTGAQGPMQFMPGTWRQYGMGGDVHDPLDAVMAAANYLKASGAPGNYRRAVFAYNHDTRYVDAVLAHAQQMRRDPRSFFAYYNWQVFVLSAKGDVRLTGPGLLKE